MQGAIGKSILFIHQNLFYMGVYFVGGMQATVGLAYGITQIGYLGTQGTYFLFRATKWVLTQLFNPRTIIAPIKLLSYLLLGSSSEQQQAMNTAWKSLGNVPPTPQQPFWFRMLKFIKTIFALAIGIGIAIALAIIKRNKTQQLNQKKEEELRMKQQQQDDMEAIWKQHQVKKIQPNLQVSENLMKDVEICNNSSNSIIEEEDSYVYSDDQSTY